MKEILAIDFDGTICDYKKSDDWVNICQPIEGAQEAIHRLSTVFEIVIFTCRAETNGSEIEEWLKKYGIPYSDITNIKPNAKAYIDNKAIRFTTWEEVQWVV